MNGCVTGNVAMCQRRTFKLLNYMGDSRNDRTGYFNSQRAGGDHIDYEIKFAGLLYRRDHDAHEFHRITPSIVSANDV